MKSEYVSPSVYVLELEGKMSILSLSEDGNGLKAVFDGDYEENDASCAFSAAQIEPFEDADN